MYELESREEQQLRFNSNVERSLTSLESRLQRVELQLTKIECVLYGNGTPGLKTLIYIILAIVTLLLPIDVAAKFLF